MTETFYRTGPHKVDRSDFGGLIYQSDFNTNGRGKPSPNGSTIAKRIIEDKKWMKNLIKTSKQGTNKKENGGIRNAEIKLQRNNH